MLIAIGASPSPDVWEAAAEAVGGALRQDAMGHKAASGLRRSDNGAAFALVLSTDQYDADTLAEAVTRELQGIPWAGCCTAGVFTGTHLLRQGLVVGVIPASAATVA